MPFIDLVFVVHPQTFASSKWDVNSANEFKYTALHVAAEANNEAAIQWLVKHGVRNARGA